MRALLCLPLLFVASQVLSATQIYATQAEFLTASFDEAPSRHSYWLNDADKQAAKKILRHSQRQLRVKYWSNEIKTAWVLEEIGKERPITIGVLIADNQVVSVTILAFRESRGWEVKFPFFTQQFVGMQLSDKQKLDRSIDNITGATLSVRAVKRAVAWALYLNQQATFEQ
mgnify:CR=1 FL=1